MVRFHSLRDVFSTSVNDGRGKSVCVVFFSSCFLMCLTAVLGAFGPEESPDIKAAMGEVTWKRFLTPGRV